jgi:hypothetical protein
MTASSSSASSTSRLEVVAHRVDVHVLVDQLDGLGAERVPESLPVPLVGCTET